VNRKQIVWIVFKNNRPFWETYGANLYNYANEHKYTTDVYESTTYIYSCLLKLRLYVMYSHTVKPLACPCLYSTILYKFAESKLWVFESLHKEKHINSTRKKVQSATQRKIHRKPAQFFENSTKLCEIYIVL
jgi:hypothetical protein